MFSNTTQPLPSHTHRILKSNKVEQATEYIKLKFKYQQSRDAFNRADRLALPGNRDAFAEHLDSEVFKASLDAEQNIKCFREPARLQNIILKNWLTTHQTGLDHPHIMIL